MLNVDESIKKILDEPTRINFKLGTTLEEAANFLLEYKKNGLRLYTDFNGILLDSNEINSVNDAYMKYMGKTKEEHDAEVKADNERRKNKNKEQEIERVSKIVEDSRKRRAEFVEMRKEQMPEIIEEGKKYIYPIYAEKWTEYVTADIMEYSDGNISVNTIELMKAYEEGLSTREVINIANNQGHTGASMVALRGAMLHFCKKGPEFWMKTNYGEISSDDMKYVEKIEKENEALESIYKRLDENNNQTEKVFTKK